MEKGFMKRISRYEAETLFNRLNVVSTQLEQNNQGIKILLSFSNDASFILQYDLHGHEKAYYYHAPVIE
jgi:hypothetical protein